MKAIYNKQIVLNRTELFSLKCPLALCPHPTLKDVTKYTSMKHTIVKNTRILLKVLFSYFSICFGKLIRKGSYQISVPHLFLSYYLAARKVSKTCHLSIANLWVS